MVWNRFAAEPLRALTQRHPVPCRPGTATHGGAMELTQEAVDRCWAELVRPLRRRRSYRRIAGASGGLVLAVSMGVVAFMLLAMLLHHVSGALSGW
jgi:hypothetical protein